MGTRKQISLTRKCVHKGGSHDMVRNNMVMRIAACFLVFFLMSGCSRNDTPAPDPSPTATTASTFPTSPVRLYGEEGLASIYIEHTPAMSRSGTDSIGIVVYSEMSRDGFHAEIIGTTYSDEEVELLTDASEFTPDRWYVFGDLRDYQRVDMRFWYEEDDTITAERCESFIMSDFNAWRPSQ